jgi:cellulose synthase/poly-beta-1,6-N-acetylglucosamine synthase-like glycosyltransferase
VQIISQTIPTGCHTFFASNTIGPIIGYANGFFFWYYAGSTVSYIALMVFAYRYSKRHNDKVRAHDLEKLSFPMPRVTIIAPAKDEQACILSAAESFLSINYPNLEVLFVDDGSIDSTFEMLQTKYQLRHDDSPYVSTLPHRPILSVWRSSNDPRLVVVRKLSAGFKGDATNAGLEIASGEYALVTDTDSLLEKEAVLRMMCVVLEDPAVIAVGGNLHAVNGCEVVHGRLCAIHSPRRYFEIAQVVEYARAFFMSRLGWSFLEMTPNISGALGLFRVDVLRTVGGYANVLAEDMEMTLKLHQHILANNLPNRLRFAPDAKVWTEVPPNYQYVASQRVRWHNSLCDVLWRFRSMLFRPQYGRIGFVLLPWFWIYELIAPVVEVTAWISIGLAAILGCLNRTLAPILIGAGYALTIVLSVLSILHSEGCDARYSASDKMKLTFQAALEVFPFRFLHVFWRLCGQINYFRGDRRWQAIPRAGFEHVAHTKEGD